LLRFSAILIFLLCPFTLLAYHMPVSVEAARKASTFTRVQVSFEIVMEEATVSTITATGVEKIATVVRDPFEEKMGMSATEVIQGIWKNLKEMKPDYVKISSVTSFLSDHRFRISIRTSETWVIGEVLYTGPATPFTSTTGVSWRKFYGTRGRRHFYQSVAGMILERVAIDRLVKRNFKGLLRLTFLPFLDEYPSFSNGGDYIAFISDRIGGNRNVHVISLKEGRIMNFPVYGSSEYFPRFSLDDSKILFQGTMYGEWDVFVMPFSREYASSIRLITSKLPNAYTPSWYDNKRILVAVDEGKGSDVYIVDTLTRVSTNLTNTPDIYEMYPYRIPNTPSIIYVRLKTDGTYGIFKHTLEGSSTVFQDEVYNEFDPMISHDGHYLVFSSNDDTMYRIWVKDLLTGEATCVSAALPYDCYYPSISPDGALIIFAAYYPDGEPDLWVAKNPFIEEW